MIESSIAPIKEESSYTHQLWIHNGKSVDENPNTLWKGVIMLTSCLNVKRKPGVVVYNANNIHISIGDVESIDISTDWWEPYFGTVTLTTTP